MLKEGKIGITAYTKKSVDKITIEEISHYLDLIDKNKDILDIAEIVRESLSLRTSIRISSIIKIYIVRNILDINRWSIIKMIYSNKLKNKFGVEKYSPMTVYNVLYRIEMFLDSNDNVSKRINKIINDVREDKEDEEIKPSIVQMKCPYCGSIDVVRVHDRRDKNPDSRVRTYLCKTCNRKFTNSMDVTQHIDEIITYWIETNDTYDKIADFISKKYGEVVTPDVIEKAIDDYIAENLKNMTQKMRGLLVRRLVFKHEYLGMNELVKMFHERYNYNILMKTVVKWLREKSIINKHRDTILDMIASGRSFKEISKWIEEKEGVIVNPAHLEDDFKVVKDGDSGVY